MMEATPNPRLSDGDPTPAQIDPKMWAQLEAMPSGEIDIEALVSHMVNGGVEADGAAAFDEAPLPTIAEREIDLVTKKDYLIADLRTQTARQSDLIDQLEEKIRTLTTDYDAKLKAQLLIANGLMADLAKKERDLAEVGAAFAEMMHKQHSVQTANRKIQIKTVRDLTDKALADLINEGWDVKFETIYVEHYDGEGDPISNNVHLIRLEREVLGTAHPPMEDARAAVFPLAPTPTPDNVIAKDDEGDVIVAGMWEEDDITPIRVPELERAFAEGLPQKTPPGLNQSAPIGQVGTLIMRQKNRGNLQRRHTEERDNPEASIRHTTLPNGHLRVGGLVLDPKRFPIAATILQHGAEATLDALDEKVKQAFIEGVQSYIDRRPKTPALPRTLGRS
jgi:hypothetical protein